MRDILIVEDGQQERERLRDVLQKTGYSVTACEAVGMAEEELRKDKFRLAILDIGLSDKSGSHLFNTMKRLGRVEFVIIFTGNPSPHLRQRLLDEGAADYIVKGSPQAQSQSIVQRIRELIGDPQQQQQGRAGIELAEFLSRYVQQSSRSLFLDDAEQLPVCKSCGTSNYIVAFDREPQVPPHIRGVVVCAGCDQVMDPEIS
ncbi:MAG: response regulator [Bdellovibrionota bacterium]|nr:MAG: response regulator [Bdellovibrionota bacterium]